MPWLSNLLPDSDDVRERWAARFRETRSDPFTLLAHMGVDAPGSVQIVPEGVEPATVGAFSLLSDGDIVRRVEGILADPDHWVEDTDEDESRFSLGGQQGKFALAHIDGQWFEPNGRAPSTHIVKPGMVVKAGHTDGHIQAVEFVTMRTARALGIRAANVELRDFQGLRAFVTERFDRRPVGDKGTVQRIHQEDFCQALAVPPARKYEQDGGPTMRDMVTLVRSAVSSSSSAADSRTLADLFLFNLLVAGVDAHAKNHGLLHVGATTRLAPAYDLISAHGVWSEDRVAYRGAAAVKYGKERPYRKITGRNLARAADVLGQSRAFLVEQMADMAARLPGAFEEAIADVPAEMTTETLRRLPQRIGTFSADLVDRTRDQDLGFREIPRFAGARMEARPGAGLWEPGQWRRGRWVTGRYRTRPAR